MVGIWGVWGQTAHSFEWEAASLDQRWVHGEGLLTKRFQPEERTCLQWVEKEAHGHGQAGVGPCRFMGFPPLPLPLAALLFLSVQSGGLRGSGLASTQLLVSAGFGSSLVLRGWFQGSRARWGPRTPRSIQDQAGPFLWELSSMATHQDVPAPSPLPYRCLELFISFCRRTKDRVIPFLQNWQSSGKLKIHHEHPEVAPALEEGTANCAIKPSPSPAASSLAESCGAGVSGHLALHAGLCSSDHWSLGQVCIPGLPLDDFDISVGTGGGDRCSGSALGPR